MELLSSVLWKRKLSSEAGVAKTLNTKVSSRGGSDFVDVMNTKISAGDVNGVNAVLSSLVTAGASEGDVTGINCRFCPS